MTRYEVWDYTKCADCGKKLISSGRKSKCGQPRRCLKCFTEWRIKNPTFTKLWKGGRNKTGGGYMAVLKRGHPNSVWNGYVLEHRLVASEMLGRPLLKGEVVHHINGDKLDNRPENLVVCKTAGEHVNQFHHRKKGPFRKCSVEGCECQHLAKGLCKSHYRKMKRKLQPGWGH